MHGAFERVGELIEGCRFKDALREVMAVAQALNRYIDAAAPWATIKSDRAAAATALYVCLQAIASLAILTAPFLPNSARRLWAMLGMSGVISADPLLLKPTGEPDMGLNRTVVVRADERERYLGAAAAGARPPVGSGRPALPQTRRGRLGGRDGPADGELGVLVPFSQTIVCRRRLRRGLGRPI